MSTYLQSTLAECGLACLGFISAHHGRAMQMNELRSRFAVSSRGTSAAGLIRFAGLLGLRSRALRMELDGLAKIPLPCILHWDLSHFVVLVSVSAKKITIHDPARGLRSITISEVSSHFTGVALEMWPEAGFEQAKAAPAISWRQLVGKVHGLRRSLAQMFILAGSLQVVALLLPLFTQWLFDGPVAMGNAEIVRVIVLGLVLVKGIRLILEFARGWLGIVTVQQFGIQWSARVINHLLRLPGKWFDVRHTGDVLSRFQSMQSIQQAVTGKMVDIALDGMFEVVTIAVMLVYSPLLASISVAAVLGYGAIRLATHGIYHRASDEAMNYEAVAQSHFLESLRAITTIKVAGLEEQRGSRWLNLIVRAANRRVRTQRLSLAFATGYGMLFAIESVAILGFGASRTIDGLMTVGMLMAFLAYKEEFSTRLQRVKDNLMSLRMLRLHVERLADILLNVPEKTDGATPEQIETRGWLDITIRFENVSFRYGEGNPWVLRNLSLEIREGQHVVIVGPTGCGKSTLTKLLLGLLEPTEGTITVGGYTLAQLGLANWRAQVGVVMQDDQLFSGSLQENIAGFSDVSDIDRVQVAAKLASIHNEILQMPMGYHTLNGDMGSSLSGGQKQRLLLARALYRQPRALVLDEATSHLDVEREQEVNISIQNLATTRVSVAHRPETIAMAERIIHLSPASLLTPAGN